MRASRMSLESIGFQNRAFFDDLTSVVEELLAAGEVSGNYYACPGPQKLLKVIRDHTGMNLQWDEEPDMVAPGVSMPYFTINHPFLTNVEREEVGRDDHIRETLKQMSVPYFSGTIDLEKAKVTGDFAKLLVKLSLPYSLLTRGRVLLETLTPREIAAIVLHEVGHGFTTIEYADRSVTTNQVLAGVSAAMRSEEPSFIAQTYASAAHLLRMTSEQRAALEECKDANGAAVLLATIAMEKSKSELGLNVFDVNACEQLADQFAARCGAAKDLVTALAKFPNTTQSAFGYWSKQAYITLALGFAAAWVSVPLVLGIVFVGVLLQDKEYELYGSFHTRMSRLRNELVQKLKDRRLSADDKTQTLVAVEQLNRMLDQQANRLDAFGALAYILKSDYRKAHNYGVLQRFLEDTTHNQLFVHSAKLSTLQPPTGQS